MNAFCDLGSLFICGWVSHLGHRSVPEPVPGGGCYWACGPLECRILEECFVDVYRPWAWNLTPSYWDHSQRETQGYIWLHVLIVTLTIRPVVSWSYCINYMSSEKILFTLLMRVPISPHSPQPFCHIFHPFLSVLPYDFLKSTVQFISSLFSCIYYIFSPIYGIFIPSFF